MEFIPTPLCASIPTLDGKSGTFEVRPSQLPGKSVAMKHTILALLAVDELICQLAFGAPASEMANRHWWQSDSPISGVGKAGKWF